MEEKASLLDPVPQPERITLIDALRGFAVFGMFIINARVFSGYSYISEEMKNDLPLADLNSIFDGIHLIFFNGKFYTLFAILFGVGFAIQFVRASGTDRPFTLHFSRRLFFLLLIGLVHLWGIWFSDILVLYALCGFLLIPFRRLSNRGLILMALLMLILSGLHTLYLNTAGGGYTTTLHQWVSDSWRASELPRASDENDMFRMVDIAKVIHEGSVGEVLKFNAIGPIIRLYFISFDARFFKILAFFMLGFWAGRNILDNNLHKNRPFLIKVALAGWLIGLPLNIHFTISEMAWIENSSVSFLRNSLVPFGYVTLTTGYTATFTLLYQTRLRDFLSKSFSSVGKAALSNYIFQSLAGIFLFYNIGLGLGVYCGSACLTVAVIAIFGLQILISRIWIKYYLYGPVEWLWRVLTYGRPIKNRRN